VFSVYENHALKNITTNFTDDSVLDEIQYSQYDQQVIYTLEKKVFGFEVNFQIKRKDCDSLNQLSSYQALGSSWLPMILFPGRFI